VYQENAIRVAAAFVLLGLLWAWVLRRRILRLRLRTFFLIFSSFAIAAALGSPSVQQAWRPFNRQYPNLSILMVLAASVVAAVLILRARDKH
jgi:hypothetical protein